MAEVQTTSSDRLPSIASVQDIPHLPSQSSSTLHRDLSPPAPYTSLLGLSARRCGVLVYPVITGKNQLNYSQEVLRISWERPLAEGGTFGWGHLFDTTKV